MSKLIQSGANTRRRHVAIALMSVALIALPGCAVKRVRADFTGFEKAFADTSNRELLLNLARLQNHDPTYFFKMGQITSAYHMTAGLQSQGSYTTQSSIVNRSNGVGTWTPNLVYESDPQFQFIPVTDEANAQLLLKPIPADTFYILYQQGWRIDQLLRLMVDRIEVTASYPTGCVVSSYKNAPPPLKITAVKAGDGTAKTVVSLDDDQMSGYTTFLRVSAIAYGLQKHGDLLLRGVSTFVPLDANAVSAAGVPDAAPKPAAAGAPAHGAEPGTPAKASGLSADAIEKAAEKSMSYEAVGTADGKILLGQRVVNPKFYLLPPKTAATAYEPDIDRIEDVLRKDTHLKGLADAQVLRIFLDALHDGFTIEGDTTTSGSTGDNPCPTSNVKHSSVHLVLRSLIGVMAAAAQEQAAFDLLQHGNVAIPVAPGTPALTFDQAVPDVERLPILRLSWKHEELTDRQSAPTSPLVELNYRGTEFLIADPRMTENSISENEFWNRDVFRLIAALTAQVTVDISKFPIANVLQF